MQRDARKKVLYIMGIDWEWIYQRPQAIAGYLSRDYEVTAAYPVKIWDRIRTGNKNGIRDTEEENADIRRLKLWVFPFQRKSRMIGRIADQYRRFRLKGYQQYEYIYVSDPLAIEYIPEDYRGLLIYDCIDEHGQMCPDENMRRRVVKDEGLLLQRSDIIIVTSQNLLQKKTKLCGKKINLVRNGTECAKICEVKGAVIKKRYAIGYTGTIAEWFDRGLIERSARKHRDLEYHLIGPSDAPCQTENRNVIYDGVVGHAVLRYHVKDYDCLIMPFMVNEVVKAVDPVKLYEYVAFGKCIISVYYDELEYFREFVYFYHTEEEYDILIRELVRQGFPPKYNETQQKEFLERNSWQERYKNIRRLMERV